MRSNASPSHPGRSTPQGTPRSAPVSGAHRVQPDQDPLTQRTRAIWTSGDFAPIAEGFAEAAAAFMARLGPGPGDRVLDVGCGTGNLTIPAARAGAAVTGLDIAPNLLAEARRLADAERLPVTLDEGNAEALPYGDASFDTVVSMFGAMFAPRPDLVASELIRVSRSGGKIAMANWTPTGFIGQMLRAHTQRVAPPQGVPSVLLWGDEATVTARFRERVKHLALTRRTLTFHYPYSPAGVVELFETCYGPTLKTFAALGPEERAELRRDLVQLWASNNLDRAGSTRVEAEYLEVLAVAQ